MKTRPDIPFLRPLLPALLAVVVVCSLRGQGALSPPGPPAPTMKTLAQIEPRRPVDALNTPGDAQGVFVITQPGAYYLTADVVATAGRSGIRVDVANSRGVSLDLNGFAVVGAGRDSGDGAGGIVSGSAATPVTVFGGRVTGWSARGVFISGPGRVHDVLVADCGDTGIEVNGGAFAFPDESRVGAIERCEVRNTGRGGIVASGARVRDCVVSRVRPAGSSGSTGIFAGQVQGSRVNNVIVPSGVFLAVGIQADQVADCVVEDVTGAGGSVHIGARLVRHSRVSRAIDALETTGFDKGINAAVVEACHVEKLQASASGGVIGIDAAKVRSSVVERVANTGSGEAFGIRGSVVASAGTGTSLTLFLHAEGNTVAGVAGVGISGAGSRARVVGNSVSGCTGDAIGQINGGIVSDNTVQISSGVSADGIDVSECVVRGNDVKSFGTGLCVRVTLSGLAVRNTARKSLGGAVYSFAAGVRAGPVVTGGGTTAFDANANVSY